MSFNLSFIFPSASAIRLLILYNSELALSSNSSSFLIHLKISFSTFKFEYKLSKYSSISTVASPACSLPYSLTSLMPLRVDATSSKDLMDKTPPILTLFKISLKSATGTIGGVPNLNIAETASVVSCCIFFTFFKVMDGVRVDASSLPLYVIAFRVSFSIILLYSNILKVFSFIYILPFVSLFMC